MTYLDEIKQRVENHAHLGQCEARSAIKRLLQLVELYEQHLEVISRENAYVESNSTGMKQFFKTNGSHIATEALALGEKLKRGEK